MNSYQFLNSDTTNQNKDRKIEKQNKEIKEFTKVHTL
jgi:hypothetical protein